MIVHGCDGLPLDVPTMLAENLDPKIESPLSLAAVRRHAINFVLLFPVFQLSKSCIELAHTRVIEIVTTTTNHHLPVSRNGVAMMHD